MAEYNYTNFNVITTLADADLFLVWQNSALDNKKITVANSCTHIGTVNTFAGLSTTNKTLVGALNEVYSSIVGESLWDRNVGSTFLYPENSGDSLNMLGGSIFGIDAANTSSTKSYQFVPTLTGVVPASEHAKIEFKGLWQGTEKTFMDYTGSSDGFNVYCQDYTYDNNSTTVSQHIYKTSLNSTGGTGIILQEFFGLNNATPTPQEYQYTQIGHIIETNSDGTEDGSISFSVSRSGTLTEYLKIDGNVSENNIQALAPFYLRNASNTIFISESNVNTATLYHSTIYKAKNSNSDLVSYAACECYILDPTLSAESSKIVFSGYNGGSLVDYLWWDGSVPKVEVGVDLFVDGAITATEAGTDGILSLTDASNNEDVRLDTNGDSWVMGNFCIGVDSSFTASTNVLTLASGTFGSALTDAIQLSSIDLSAGNTMLAVKTEGTSSGTGTGDNTSDGYVVLKWNGTTHYVLTKSTQPV